MLNEILNLNGFAALAPMAGVADRAMREICVEYGAAYTVGELASARGITLGDVKSAGYLTVSPKCRPFGVQLFGNQPEIMAAAAKIAEGYAPDFIDINMGCPAPKVAGNGGGSALLRDLPLAEAVTEAVVKAVHVPVAVKMRTGWDETEPVAPLLAKRVENAGAAAVTVHGRTRKQMYAGGIDFETIAAVKQAVKIPVIGNGNICCGADAKAMYDRTGCDFVMVGRAAMGNPFVFDEINACFTGRPYTRPSLAARLAVLKRQVLLMAEYKDPYIAMLESRKHAAWYMSGLHSAAALRRACGEIKSFEDLCRICEKALEENENM